MKRFTTLFIAFFILSGFSLLAQDKPDALKLFKDARYLQDQGRSADANLKYAEAIAVCDAEITLDPNRTDAYVVKCWSLFRLGKHQEVIQTGTPVFNKSQDLRLAEQMAESYFYLADYQNSLRLFRKYIDGMPEKADRIPTVYFFLGEIYTIWKQNGHADIAYTTAVNLEPSMPRWWLRLGNTKERIGETQGALIAYERAIKLNPNFSEALAAKARVQGASQSQTTTATTTTQP